jgi:hypothetical protein
MAQPHHQHPRCDQNPGANHALNDRDEDDGYQYRRPLLLPIPQEQQDVPQLPVPHAQLALHALPQYAADEPVETQQVQVHCHHQIPHQTQSHRNPPERRRRQQVPPGENARQLEVHRMIVMVIDDEGEGWFRRIRNYVKAYQNSAGQKSKKQQSTQADRFTHFHRHEFRSHKRRPRTGNRPVFNFRKDQHQQHNR